MNGIEGLKNKIEKDIKHAEGTISSIQSQIQFVVAERKQARKEWEALDSRMEQDINQLLSHLSEVQGRQLLGMELLETYFNN